MEVLFRSPINPSNPIDLYKHPTFTNKSSLELKAITSPFLKRDLNLILPAIKKMLVYSVKPKFDLHPTTGHGVIQMLVYF